MYCVHAFFQEFFSFLLPLLQGSVQLLEVYSDTAEVVGVVLELFALTADNYIVFLKEVRNRQRGVLISKGCGGWALGPGDVSLLERCPHFRGCYVQLLLTACMHISYATLQEQTLELYKVCLDLIQSYTKSNTGKYRSGRQSSIEEEEQCEDLLQFMKMTHLTIKDYVDFGNCGRPLYIIIDYMGTRSIIHIHVLCDVVHSLTRDPEMRIP